MPNNEPSVRDEQLTSPLGTRQYFLSNDDMVKKSNALINRIGKTSLTSEKILLEAIANIRPMSHDSIDDPLLKKTICDVKERTGISYADGYVSILQNADLKKAIGSNSGHYYHQIDFLMNGNAFMNSWNILYMDNKISSIINIISSATYNHETGTTFIKWNPEAVPLVLDLTRNYTEIPRRIMQKFKSIYSFSVYQMLRSEMCLRSNRDNKYYDGERDEYIIKYSLSEFKFLSRIIDVDMSARTESTKKVIDAIKDRDYEMAEQEAGSNYISSDYRELRREVLNKVFQEINGFPNTGFEKDENMDEYNLQCSIHHQTDLHFRFRPVKNGLGGKVVGVEFYVRWDNPEAEQETVPNDGDDVPAIPMASDNDRFYDRLIELFDEKMSLTSLKSIATAADWNYEKIEKVYRLAKASKTPVLNLTGFMISAIRNGYETTTPEQQKQNQASRSVAYNAHNYAEHHYSKEQLISIERTWRKKTSENK